MDSSSAPHTFLRVLGIMFVPYGLFCLVYPGFLATAAGVAGVSATGVTEIRAMYGGLQAGFGVLLLMAARDDRLLLGGLAAVAFVLPGLALARLLGVALDGAQSGYTMAALIFEISSSLIAVVLFRASLGKPQFEHLG